MCEDCAPMTDRERIAGFMADQAEHFSLMAQGKKHNVISEHTALNWSQAYKEAADLLRPLPNEPTPITQEDKPLSPEIMPTTLRKYRDLCAQWAAEDADMLAFLEREHGAVPSDADKRKARIANFRQEATALEQAIAILSMLNRPWFRKAEHIVAGGDLGGYCFAVLPEGDSGIFRQVGHHAATVMDAILKVHTAHAALKPQEGAASGKEPAND